MREIKFRVWDGKKMFVPAINHSGFDLNELLLSFDSDGVKVMQYTGLKDKNGVEIYEGDYVKTTYHTNKVEHFGLVDWVDYGFGIRRRTTETSDKLQVYGAAPLPDSSRIEVIGNIYETPEQLKENK